MNISFDKKLDFFFGRQLKAEICDAW